MATTVVMLYTQSVHTYISYVCFFCSFCLFSSLPSCASSINKHQRGLPGHSGPLVTMAVFIILPNHEKRFGHQHLLHMWHFGSMGLVPPIKPFVAEMPGGSQVDKMMFSYLICHILFVQTCLLPYVPSRQLL